MVGDLLDHIEATIQPPDAGGFHGGGFYGGGFYGGGFYGGGFYVDSGTADTGCGAAVAGSPVSRIRRMRQSSQPMEMSPRTP